MYVGVDGCAPGWIALVYDDKRAIDTGLYPDIETLWEDVGAAAETVLIDVPIGLSENTGEPRAPDDAARRRLGTRRGSVFPVPVRAAAHAADYETAKAIQEQRTDRSLGVQSWNIANRIAELDDFLLESHPEARGVVREAHPEICFWALDGESSTTYSKTGQPAAAFWERVSILENVDASIVEHLRAAAMDLDAAVGNDDVVDAAALALTACPRTARLRTLPADPPTDPAGLPMEMVYAGPP